MGKTVECIKDNRLWIKARPLNCDFETSLEKRCKHCGQNHLTPGYCQALDPINADKYPEFHQHKKPVIVETDNETDSISETDKVCSGCGEAFHSKRIDARYCSSACRLKAHRGKS